MAVPDSITVSYTNEIPLAPRLDQEGLRIVAGTTASEPVLLPGEDGDILDFLVEGDYDVHFKFVSTILGRATTASQKVWAKRDVLFVVPKKPPGKQVYISVLSPAGDSVVILNTYSRGT